MSERREAPRIEAWYRDSTWTDALRVSLAVSDLDRLERYQREHADEMDDWRSRFETRVGERLAELDAKSTGRDEKVNRKLDRLTAGVGGLMALGLGILLTALMQGR